MPGVAGANESEYDEKMVDVGVLEPNNPGFVEFTGKVWMISGSPMHILMKFSQVSSGGFIARKRRRAPGEIRSVGAVALVAVFFFAGGAGVDPPFPFLAVMKQKLLGPGGSGGLGHSRGKLGRSRGASAGRCWPGFTREYCC